MTSATVGLNTTLLNLQRPITAITYSVRSQCRSSSIALSKQTNKQTNTIQIIFYYTLKTKTAISEKWGNRGVGWGEFLRNQCFGEYQSKTDIINPVSDFRTVQNTQSAFKIQLFYILLLYIR